MAGMSARRARGPAGRIDAKEKELPVDPSPPESRWRPLD